MPFQKTQHYHDSFAGLFVEVYFGEVLVGDLNRIKSLKKHAFMSLFLQKKDICHEISHFFRFY